MTAELLMNLARVVGLGAACATMALYVGALWEVTLVSLFAQAVMVLALVAAWASIAIKPFVLCAVSVPSFVPPLLSFGFTPVFIGLIFLCNVLYLVAAGLMLVAIGLRGISDGAGGGNI